MERGRPCVYLPELEKPPSEYHYQRKMFAFHKNMDSAGFLVGTDSVTQHYRNAVLAMYQGKQPAPPSSRHFETRETHTELRLLREQLRQKQMELDTLRSQQRQSVKNLNESNLRNDAPKLQFHRKIHSFADEEFRSLRPKNNNSLEYHVAARRLLDFPRYTRSHPKPAGLNPITGLRSQSVL